MKLKTNKLLTLTLASSLVAITAGCGGTKAAAPKTGTPTTPPVDTVTYSDWSGSDDVTVATVVTDNAFLAGTAAVAAVGTTTAAVAANLTGLPTGEDATILTLASEVAEPVGTLTAINLGGEAADGVGFATTGAGDAARYFAGVIAGTDLGAPLTATTVTGTWAGLFQAIGADGTYATDAKAFELTVTFSATGDDTITALVAANDNEATFGAGNDASYYISGTYDAAGVITGNVLYGDFSASNTGTVLTDAGTALTAATADDADDTATAGLGVLSGLIGANGAVGAFYSTAEDATGFAGGFVASKTPDVGGDDTDAVYADWSGSATLVTAITANGFVAGTATGLDLTPALTTGVETLDLNDEYAAAVPVQHGTNDVRAGTPGAEARLLPGAATNGVAFAMTGTGDDARYFAGLHDTTDLGAPLSAAPTTAIWNGLFQAVGSGDYATAAKAFALTVTYSATADSTIIGLVGANTNADAFTAAGTSYYISGTYNADGVISGNVLYRDFSAADGDDTARTAAAGLLTTATADDADDTATAGLGVLSGLIGATGAVGAFYSNADGATGYAGGFVATSTPIPAANSITATAFDPISYTDWTGSFTNPALTAAATTLATAPAGNAFVHGVAAGLSLPSAVTGTVALGLDAGDLTGDATDGVAFVTTGATTAARFYAGVLDGTDLGGPLDATTAAGTWSGSFQAVGADGTYATDAKNFTLTVDFANTAFSAHVAAGAATATFADPATAINSYYLAGTFAATGVMTGTIIYGDYGTGNTTQTASTTAAVAALADTTNVTAGRGTVTGLIGTDGAVGAFISTATGATDGYAGGFVANNP